MTYPNHPKPQAQSMGSTNTVFNTEMRFDPSYLKTLPGILKCVVILFNLIGFICVQSSAFWSNGRGVFFNLVANLGFWFSGGLLILYLLHLVEKYHNIKWLQIEMVACAGMVFLYMVASSIVVAFGSVAYSVAGFFGYLAMVLYGVDAYIKLTALKAGELPQGHRVVTKQAHVVTPPALP